jgi:hypothetical protein
MLWDHNLVYEDQLQDQYLLQHQTILEKESNIEMKSLLLNHISFSKYCLRLPANLSPFHMPLLQSASF